MRNTAVVLCIFLLPVAVCLGCATGGRRPPADGGESNPPPAPHKVDVWAGSVKLRGANIWQTRVYADVWGDSLGPGPIGPPYTQADFSELAAMGANCVNISHPGLYGVDPPYALDEDAQANLDALLDLIRRADMFAVITFRTGPRRSEFTFFAGESREEDPENGWFPQAYYNDTVWQSQEAQDAWAEMWRHTAERYASSRVVVGYDLMCEPNGNTRVFGIDEPQLFYPSHAGRIEDWNRFYPSIVQAIREVDTETPVLVGGMGWSGIGWLPYLVPTDDPAIVYTVHQYEPFAYTHQDPPLSIAYPGTADLGPGNGQETFDRSWLESLLSTVAAYKDHHDVVVAANEFGVQRYEPGAAEFIRDETDLFDQQGTANAVWQWEPAFMAEHEYDSFDFKHGPDPANHTNVAASALMNTLRTYWSRNTARPSNTSFE